MAHVNFLHDDLADPTLALDAGLTVQYVEVLIEGLDDPQEVVQVSGDRADLEKFLSDWAVTEYRIED